MCRVAPRVAALEGATFLAAILAHGPEARGLLHGELCACGVELLTAYDRSDAPQVARPVAQAPAAVDIAVLRKPDVPGVPVPVRQVRRQDIGVEWAPAVDIIRKQVLPAVVKAQVKAQTSGDQASECQHLPGAPVGKQPEANDYNACECRREVRKSHRRHEGNRRQAKAEKRPRGEERGKVADAGLQVCLRDIHGLLRQRLHLSLVLGQAVNRQLTRFSKGGGRTLDGAVVARGPIDCAAFSYGRHLATHGGGGGGLRPHQ
mmetsp:Transcript_91551/g.262211  ORF Transcript_91551/g.262211 Transcript_91551/m.262211 type:complete len:261 (-) Transcript_91551:120-902(-)